MKNAYHLSVSKIAITGSLCHGVVRQKKFVNHCYRQYTIIIISSTWTCCSL